MKQIPPKKYTKFDVMKFSYDIVSTKSINPATSLEISIYISNQNKISEKHTWLFLTSFNSL